MEIRARRSRGYVVGIIEVSVNNVVSIIEVRVNNVVGVNTG